MADLSEGRPNGSASAHGKRLVSKPQASGVRTECVTALANQQIVNNSAPKNGARAVGERATRRASTVGEICSEPTGATHAGTAEWRHRVVADEAEWR